MPYSVKGFFEINEDMVQILLMLEVLFTQDSKVEDLFCGASSGSDPNLFFSNYFVGKRTGQKDINRDITSDSQVNSYLPYRWSPASPTIDIYFYLFLYLYNTNNDK